MPASAEAAAPPQIHAVAPPSRWRPGPRRLSKLMLGLVLFGVGEGLMVAAGVGVSPWTVLAQGVSNHTPLAVGTATVVISFFVLLAWIPLKQRPGLGTVMNAVVIGLVIDATLLVVDEPGPLALQLLLAGAGIALVGIGSGFYLTAFLGPGPRDGLMTGLSRLSGSSLRLVRAAIEVSAVAAGAILGGTVGVGTVAFALLIGPAVQASVHALAGGNLRHL